MPEVRFASSTPVILGIISPPFSIYVIPYMDIQLFHLIRIVQGGALYDRSRKLDRFEVGHGGDRSRAADLVIYRKKLRQCPLCLELECSGPAGGLCRVSQPSLDIQLVYLYDYPVRSERKEFPADIPFAYVPVHFFHGTAQPYMFGNREPP